MKEPREGWKSVAAASWRDDAKDFARKSVFPQKKQDRGPNFSFWQVNYGKLLEIDLFFFAITFGELPNSKIWETKNPKLLELL